jgi:hypothetical protein
MNGLWLQSLYVQVLNKDTTIMSGTLSSDSRAPSRQAVGKFFVSRESFTVIGPPAGRASGRYPGGRFEAPRHGFSSRLWYRWAYLTGGLRL